MSSVQVAGRTVHYELRGEGPPVVLLHSIGVDHSIYAEQVLALEPDHRLLLFDLRGHGLSELGGADEPSLEILAEDLHGLLRTLDIGAAHLVGQSIGGMTVLAFVSRFAGWPGTAAVFDVAAHSTPDWDDRYLARGAAVAKDGMSAVEPHVIRRALGATTQARRPELVTRYIELLGRARPDGYAWACRALVGFDHRDRLEAVRCPMLVAVGEEDLMTTPEHARAIAARVPAAELVTLPETGHVPCLEAPARVSDLIRDWVRRHPLAGA